jgi:hypothetical protein
MAHIPPAILDILLRSDIGQSGTPLRGKHAGLAP